MRTADRHACVLLLSLLALPAAARQEAVEARPPAPPPLLARVAVVGASVSNGFGSGLPLATLLDAAIRAEHTPVLNACAGVQNPAWFGEMQIERCLAHEPSVVVGVDFLFWYAHRVPARGETELEVRLEVLRSGLAQLDRLSCPIVVGDIPDMSAADRKRLVPALVPSAAVRDALNEEVREWAGRKENVLLVPLSEWVAVLQRGEWKIAASADGVHPEKVLTAGEALLDDGLHPRKVGAVVLAGRVLDAMKKRFTGIVAGVDYDVWRVLDYLHRQQDAQDGEEDVGG